MKKNTKEIRKYFLRKKKGITLIALVITIIVLLILAGVALSLVAGSNGTINRASQSADETKIAGEKEQIELAYVSATVEKLNSSPETSYGTNVTDADLQKELDSSVGKDKTKVTLNGDNTLNVLFYDTDHNYNVNNGTVITDEVKNNLAKLTDIYVFLYDDNTLTFGTSSTPDNTKTLSKEYGNIKGHQYLFDYDNWNSNVPWYDDIGNIKVVEILDRIIPINTAGWFAGAKELKEIKKIYNLNTEFCTNMSCMFLECKVLESLDLTSFKTNNVTDMSHMFEYCEKLADLNITSFNTSKVTDMEYMFESCAFTSIDLSSFDTSNVENMVGMFYGAGIVDIDLTNFETKNVTVMDFMFRDCYNLERLNISNWNTSKVEYMEYMFEDCDKLLTIDLSSFDTQNLKSTYYMFYDCDNLETIFAKEDWNTISAEGGFMFSGCDKLKGGAGTLYERRKRNGDYARVDGGAEKPGYFTVK